MIQLLFQQIATADTLRSLNLVDVLDWASAALNRVDRTKFVDQFEKGLLVQYFYEPFLEVFDPELRKSLGVWYTPHEVVEYMVERVDTALRDELGLPDGLASPEVYVLDPATGTGSFVIAALQRIATTLKAKGEDALLGNDIKRAAMSRVFGFELLPAPFVIAHLQLGLLLQDLGVPLSETPLPDGSYERAAVYLTNSLTGWDPPKGPRQNILFSQMAEERDAASRVKTAAPILVILGNPPYDGFAGVSPKEEDELLEAYKEGFADWGITKNSLDNLYVRFFRMAEKRIAERTGRGIVCYITPYSYITDRSFVVMRQHLLKSFDTIWIDSLNGDSRWTGKLTPDGKPDPSIFSTEFNKEGIQVGTSISMAVRSVGDGADSSVHFRQFWGANKRNDLIDSLLEEPFGSAYQRAKPNKDNLYSLRPIASHPSYDTWPALVDIAEIGPFLGLNDNRGQATFDISANIIRQRMRSYYDKEFPFSELGRLHRGLVTNAAGFNAETTRTRLTRDASYNDENVVPFFFKPFDLRTAYIERKAKLWNRVRPELLDQMGDGSEFILSRHSAPKAFDGAALYYTRAIADQHVLHKDAYFFPVRMRQKVRRAQEIAAGQQDFTADLSTKANLSPAARAYLSKFGLPDPDDDTQTARLLWMHALAIGYTPAYLAENTDRIQMDWPRIPLPAQAETLLASAALGSTLASLLDHPQAVPGVTAGRTRADLAVIGLITPLTSKALDAGAGDLAVRVDWGHFDKDGAVMPGQGRVTERPYTEAEHAAIQQAAEALGMTVTQAIDQLGVTTFDVHLNDLAIWRNVPARVWHYTIGGFPVLKKWLSYREQSILGRALTAAEAREFRDTARRLGALALLEPALDASYHATCQATYPWTVSVNSSIVQ
jgi:hypothetical protein